MKRLTLLCRSVCVSAALAGIQLASGAENAVATKAIATETRIGLENGLVSISFDKQTGAMVSLKNLATGDEYLKSPTEAGNPFRIHADTTELPRAAAQGMPFPVTPPEGAMGGKLADPRNCRLRESSFEHVERTGVLRLVLRHPETQLSFLLNITLPDGDVAADLDLAVRNDGTQSHTVMAAVPYLTGVCLGDNPETNRGMKATTARAPAWETEGGVYGQMWSMQWDAVYDTAANEGLGVIVKDGELAGNKVFHRFKPGGMSVLFFPDRTLQPSETVRYPTASVIVHSGSWRVVARRYRRWFESTFKPCKQPKWFDDATKYVGLVWGEQRSFLELDRGHMTFPYYDVVEWAGYWDGVVGGMYEPRRNCGGMAALHQGIAAAHRIGRSPSLYLGTFSLNRNSPLLQGTNPRDWMLMDRPPQGKEDVPEHFFACLGYKPWQDHLVATARRLIQGSGAKVIRLDEFGGLYCPCHNPAHHHESPFEGPKCALEFARRVRAAIDEVDPEVVILSEGGTDVLNQYLNGMLVMWSPGPELAPMRLAVPNYRLIAHHLGSVEAALNGFVCRQRTATNNGPAWVSDEYFDRLYGWGFERKPKGYREPGPLLRWNELMVSFVDAVLFGDPTDEDPVAVPALAAEERDNWASRLWRSPKYWLLLCGHRDGSPLAAPMRVRLPELPAAIERAFEIDTATLAVREAELSRGAEGTIVTVTSGLAAVLLPLPDCPPLALVEGEQPVLKRGAKDIVSLEPFSPWRAPFQPRVQVEIAGLEVEPTEVQLPAGIGVNVRTDTLQGMYRLKVTGDCLPLKRWIQVKE